MAYAKRTMRMAYTVPEVWRRIVKWGESQGSGKFDVLVCGHVVVASDTAYRRFRACPDCRVKVQQYADLHAGTGRLEAQAAS